MIVSSLTGVPVVLSRILRDGEVVIGFDLANAPSLTQVLMIGTRPMTDIEFAGAQARQTVQQALADVLEWCGLKPDPEPRRSGKGRELYERLREQADDDAIDDGIRTCRECGCTDARACCDELDQPCWWVGADLCSRCLS